MAAPGVRHRQRVRAEHPSRPPPPTPTAQHRTVTAVSPEGDPGELGSEHGSLRALVVSLDVDDEARIHDLGVRRPNECKDVCVRSAATGG